MTEDEKTSVLAEVEQVFDDADKVIAYYLDRDQITAFRTGNAASASMRALGESVLHRLRGVS